MNRGLVKQMLSERGSLAKLALADYLTDYAECPLFIAALRKNARSRMHATHYGFARWLTRDYVEIPSIFHDLGFRSTLRSAYLSGLRICTNSRWAIGEMLDDMLEGREIGPTMLIEFHGNGYLNQIGIWSIGVQPMDHLYLASVKRCPNRYRLLIAEGASFGAGSIVYELSNLLCYGGNK